MSSFQAHLPESLRGTMVTQIYQEQQQIYQQQQHHVPKAEELLPVPEPQDWLCRPGMSRGGGVRRCHGAGGPIAAGPPDVNKNHYYFPLTILFCSLVLGFVTFPCKTPHLKVRHKELCIIF